MKFSTRIVFGIQRLSQTQMRILLMEWKNSKRLLFMDEKLKKFDQKSGWNKLYLIRFKLISLKSRRSLMKYSLILISKRRTDLTYFTLSSQCFLVLLVKNDLSFLKLQNGVQRMRFSLVLQWLMKFMKKILLTFLSCSIFWSSQMRLTLLI